MGDRFISLFTRSRVPLRFMIILLQLGIINLRNMYIVHYVQQILHMPLIVIGREGGFAFGYLSF